MLTLGMNNLTVTIVKHDSWMPDGILMEIMVNIDEI